MRILAIFEPLFALALVWVVANIIHAVMSMPDEKANQMFWSLSAWIKSNFK